MTSQEEPEQLTVDVEEPQPGVLVAQLTGWLDLATAPGAEIQLQELLDTRAPRSIVVDLSRTEFLGSAGVAVLLRLRRGALARGCEPPCLVGLSGTARRTLHGLGLLEMFSTADDVAAAMPLPPLGASRVSRVRRPACGPRGPSGPWVGPVPR